MFFARPFSAADAAFLVVAGLVLWALLLVPGRSRTAARMRRLGAAIGALAIAVGAYALAFRTETIHEHHRLLDLRTQGAVAAVLLLGFGEAGIGRFVRPIVGALAVCALLWRAYAPERFLDDLRDGLFLLNAALAATLVVSLAAGARGLRTAAGAQP